MHVQVWTCSDWLGLIGSSSQPHGPEKDWINPVRVRPIPSWWVWCAETHTTMAPYASLSRQTHIQLSRARGIVSLARAINRSINQSVMARLLTWVPRDEAQGRNRSTCATRVKILHSVSKVLLSPFSSSQVKKNSLSERNERRLGWSVESK